MSATTENTATLQRALKAVLPHVGDKNAPATVQHVLVDFTNNYVWATDRYTMARARFHLPEVDVADRVTGQVLLSKDDAAVLSKFSEKVEWNVAPAMGEHPRFESGEVMVGFTVSGELTSQTFNHVFDYDYPNIGKLLENSYRVTGDVGRHDARSWFALGPYHLEKLAMRHTCRDRSDRLRPFVFYAPQNDPKPKTVRIEFADYLTVLIVEIGPITDHPTE